MEIVVILCVRNLNLLILFSNMEVHEHFLGCICGLRTFLFVHNDPQSQKSLEKLIYRLQAELYQQIVGKRKPKSNVTLQKSHIFLFESTI